MFNPFEKFLSPDLPLTKQLDLRDENIIKAERNETEKASQLQNFLAGAEANKPIINITAAPNYGGEMMDRLRAAASARLAETQSKLGLIPVSDKLPEIINREDGVATDKPTSENSVYTNEEFIAKIIDNRVTREIKEDRDRILPQIEAARIINIAGEKTREKISKAKSIEELVHGNTFNTGVLLNLMKKGGDIANFAKLIREERNVASIEVQTALELSQYNKANEIKEVEISSLRESIRMLQGELGIANDNDDSVALQAVQEKIKNLDVKRQSLLAEVTRNSNEAKRLEENTRVDIEKRNKRISEKKVEFEKGGVSFENVLKAMAAVEEVSAKTSEKAREIGYARMSEPAPEDVFGISKGTKTIEGDFIVLSESTTNSQVAKKPSILEFLKPGFIKEKINSIFSFMSNIKDKIVAINQIGKTALGAGNGSFAEKSSTAINGGTFAALGLLSIFGLTPVDKIEASKAPQISITAPTLPEVSTPRANDEMKSRADEAIEEAKKSLNDYRSNKSEPVIVDTTKPSEIKNYFSEKEFTIKKGDTMISLFERTIDELSKNGYYEMNSSIDGIIEGQLKKEGKSLNPENIKAEKHRFIKTALLGVSNLKEIYTVKNIKVPGGKEGINIVLTPGMKIDKLNITEVLISFINEINKADGKYINPDQKEFIDIPAMETINA